VRGVATAALEVGVRFSDEAGREDLLGADALVLADRRVPERPPGLEALGVEVQRIGDARRPRDITAAIAEGREAIDALTRHSEHEVVG